MHYINPNDARKFISNPPALYDILDRLRAQFIEKYASKNLINNFIKNPVIMTLSLLEVLIKMQLDTTVIRAPAAYLSGILNNPGGADPMASLNHRLLKIEMQQDPEDKSKIQQRIVGNKTSWNFQQAAFDYLGGLAPPQKQRLFERFRLGGPNDKASFSISCINWQLRAYKSYMLDCQSTNRFDATLEEKAQKYIAQINLNEQRRLFERHKRPNSNNPSDHWSSCLACSHWKIRAYRFTNVPG